LGGSLHFHYSPAQTSLEPGDTILLMSDGFPELFNESQEILDYTRVKDIFAETAFDTPENIISYLNKAGEKWRNSRAQADDVTFIVLKIKGDHRLRKSEQTKER
jgi:serine phosphatase RsbU (regulator of sigma subunit)